MRRYTIEIEGMKMGAMPITPKIIPNGMLVCAVYPGAMKNKEIGAKPASFNLKTAIEPPRHQGRQGKQRQKPRFGFTFWVNCGAVENPYSLSLLKAFKTPTAGFRFNRISKKGPA